MSCFERALRKAICEKLRSQSAAGQRINGLLIEPGETDRRFGKGEIEIEMGQILQFRLPAGPSKNPNYDGLDLLSAVDFALRDLADIANHLTSETAREQAVACRQMLEAAFHAELEGS